ncbi:carnitine O-acetyltransferase-like [Anneissia japonica]|uniref:carnitine O-acetyltransferase-like n=1 Tax=Anneissia japonica TaxID=1529436 RepID=UPI0014254B8A|nr:carnitine O-acetyltransferase-like [Anneissia japonica]
MEVLHVVKYTLASTMKQALRPTACLIPVKAKPGCMFIHQRHLPKLPVPPLQQTLYRYLLSIKPLVSDADFDATKKLVDNFGQPGGLGEKLQMGLIDRAKKMDNWVTYVTLIYFSSKFSQTLPVDKLGGSPLCMDQYYKILSSCRIPGRKIDSIVTYPADGSNSSKHIVVAHNNQFFSLDLFKNGWTPLTRSEIYHQLCNIVNKSKNPSTPVGILTSENRNTWGKIYNEMSKDRTNRTTFDKINRGFVLLCLDEKFKSVPEEELDSEFGRQLLHGGGSQFNSGNRWADKTLQVIIGPNGRCGLQYEHAPAEGPPIATFLDHILAYCDNVGDHISPSKEQPAPAKRLMFNINPDVQEAIENAKIAIDSMVEDLDLHIFKFKLFGKDFVKANKLSPDGFIQIALQLAYFKSYGEACATYESASLRRYQFGRTDTIRSCSTDSDLFVRSMIDGNKTNSELVRLMKQAIESHKEYTNLAIFGDGVDRHLLGLKLMAIEWGWNVPELMMDTTYHISTHFKLSTSQAIFGDGVDRHLLGLKLMAIEWGWNVPELMMDTTYHISTHFKLSTSQVPAKSDSTLCFGPVVPDGFGVCYNPKSKHINFAVSAFNTSPETDAKIMSVKLTESLADMHNILVQGSLSAKL